MTKINYVQFFKLENGDGVGEIIETISMLRIHFDNKAAFEKWAKKALLNRIHSGSNSRPPDAVRFCTDDGNEKFRWTYWDQLGSGKAMADGE